MEALFYERTGKDAVCRLCRRFCRIPPGGTGFCRVRKNESGRLEVLNYGRVAAASVDPVEKKPFFHFAPGSLAFSICSVGCNFSCGYCCNWNLSREWTDFGEEMSPEDVVNAALSSGSQGISYTYTEPTVFFEFASDCAKLARKSGLYNTFVTNGYASEEAVSAASGFLDAAVIDFKAAADPEFYRKHAGVRGAGEIFRTLEIFFEKGVFVEVTNLVIPRLGDDRRRFEVFCKRISDISPEIPLHVLRYFPSYRFSLPPTPEKTILEFVEIARKAGLKYVYPGNLPSGLDTVCGCGRVLIKRVGLSAVSVELKCPECGFEPPVKGRKWIPKNLLKTGGIK